MNVKDIKVLRGQVRQAVKEELEGVLSKELLQIIEKSILEKLNGKLNLIHKQVEESLKNMDKKVNDGVSYLIRHTGSTPMKVDVDKK